ncbi:MAG: Na+/H+ antiporter subunit E [Lachnospiraceae bacterium]|nr:Na+/H+ antiporter subunit E [Lachnospiraceae bacterium]
MTAIWCILQESFTIYTIVIGLLISIAGMVFVHHFLALPKISGIKPRIFIYPFYLLWQVYIADFSVIKTIFSNPHVEIVKIKTKLTNNALRLVLANSISLVPGSLSLDLNEDEITVLWLGEKSKLPDSAEGVDEIIKGKLERALLKSQKN